MDLLDASVWVNHVLEYSLNDDTVEGFVFKGDVMRITDERRERTE